MWTTKGTLGWHTSGFVIIVIDLQKQCRIEEIAYHAAGGGHADIYFPARSEFFVSENGVDYTLVKTITPADDDMTEEPRRATIHTFSAKKINRTGRYIMLGLRQGEQSGYIFVDEVYVNGESLTDKAEVLPAADATCDVANYYLTRISNAVDNGAPMANLIVDRRTHMRSNLRRIEKAVDSALPGDTNLTPAQQTAYQTLKAQIKILKESIPSNPDETQWRTFITTTLGLYSRATALPLAGKGYLVWNKDMWDPLRLYDMPAGDTPVLKTISIRAIGNEYESACVTVMGRWGKK